MRPAVPFPDLDATWLAALRASYGEALQRHRAVAAVAAPERAMFAWDAVANDGRQLLALDHAAGAPADALRRSLADAARAHFEVVTRRGASGALPPGGDFATGHSRSTYLAICMALAGGDAALARSLAPFVWDPPSASYVGPGSVLCTPEQQALADALKHSLLGDDRAAGLALGRVTRISGEGIGELLMLRGLVEDDARRFLDGLARQLDAQARLAAEAGPRRLPDGLLCLPALGLAALALRRGCVSVEQLPAGNACFPRDVIAPPPESPNA